MKGIDATLKITDDGSGHARAGNVGITIDQSSIDINKVLDLVKDNKPEQPCYIVDDDEEDIYKDNSIEVNVSYPYSDIYEYITYIDSIDLDKECEKDLNNGTGFIISSPQKTNKRELKNPDGIYSSRFGQKLGDKNPFADRYSCECGNLKSHINHGLKCPICGKVCKFVDDRFDIFGWIKIIDQYHVIHPKHYDTLEFLCGASKFNTERKKTNGASKKTKNGEKKKAKSCTKLRNMLNHSPEVDEHGFIHPCEFKPDKEPFYGIGMIEFYERFDEIIDYYLKKYPKKQKYYDELQSYRYSCDCGLLNHLGKTVFYEDNKYIATEGCTCPKCKTKVKWIDKDQIFTHSIPVYTTHLRPVDVRDDFMYFESTNGLYNMINKHAHRINKVKRQYDREPRQKNAGLYKLQMKWCELNDEIMETLKGKKGTIRQLIGGRFNFSCRAVIIQDASLRCDQVKLPYVELVICLKQVIQNVLMRTYNISPGEAHEIWRKAVAKKDERVCEILDALIKTSGEGLPIILNRNPTLS